LIYKSQLSGLEIQMKKIFFVAMLIAPAHYAIAGTPVALPEPGALSLLGIGAVAALAIWARNRNKK
jgi:hypothetical protein